ELVCAGTPHQIEANPRSHTGVALKEYRAALAELAKLRAPTLQSTAKSPLPPFVKGGSHSGEINASFGSTHESGAILLPPLEKGGGGDLPFVFANHNAIRIHNAREHNLKGVDVEIPRERFTVVTGVSGSGKSTLAFDILFAEGQRRYLESLNAYARQFVQPAARPAVDAIFGMPPTVAVEQPASRGGRTLTVETLTELSRFLRLLYVKLGTQYCPDHAVPIAPQTPDSIVASLLARHRDRRVLLLAPLVMARKGYYTDLAKRAAR